jgi:chromate transporter
MIMSGIAIEKQQQLPKPLTYEYSLVALVLYFLKLGTIGFGGPVALVGYMFRDLVEKRKWITEPDYKDGLALAQLAPGPLAAQLSFYIGYLRYGVLGSSLVGLAFVLPSFLMVLTLGWVYTKFGGITWMQAVFYAVGASVISIIALSAYKLSLKTNGKDKLLWTIFSIVVLYTVWTEKEEVLMFLGAGVIYWLIKSPSNWFQNKTGLVALLSEPSTHISSSLMVTDTNTLSNLFFYFAKAGAFVFGSGLAIIPFLYSGVVNEYHWLTNQEFVDAVAVAMITPGPVVITTGFIGFLVAGFPGASIAALGTFLPAFLLTIIPAPFFRKYGRRPGIVNFVTGVTAAATGAIMGAVIVLGKRSIIDFPTTILAIATLLLLWKYKKIPEPIVVLIAALIGLLVYPLMHS